MELDPKTVGDRLVRFLFPLPSPLPVPDGWTFCEAPGIGSPPLGPMAWLTFWQEQQVIPPTGDDLNETMTTARRIGLARAHDGQAATAEGGVQRRVTVVDAITEWRQPTSTPDGWDGDPENLWPEQDPIVRCVALAQQIVRSFRLVKGEPLELPTYERLPIALVLYFAEGRLTREPPPQVPPPSQWTAEIVMKLNHWNIPLDTLPAPPWEEVSEPSGHWIHALRSGAPAVLARENLAEAQIAMRQQGLYADAVVKANTSCEVLLDAFLSALLWEEHLQDATKPGPEACAAHFSESRLKARVNSMLIPRLRGNWSSSESAFTRWQRGAHALRHRVIHAAYSPTRQEASNALDDATRLQQLLFDRLVTQRNQYPRATLLLVGPDGLIRRGVLEGAIKRFYNEVAPTEASWVENWGQWHQRLVNAAIERD